MCWLCIQAADAVNGRAFNGKTTSGSKFVTSHMQPDLCAILAETSISQSLTRTFAVMQLTHLNACGVYS